MLFTEELVQFTQDELNITGFGIKENDTKRTTGFQIYLSERDSMMLDPAVTWQDYIAHLRTDNAILLSSRLSHAALTAASIANGEKMKRQH